MIENTISNNSSSESTRIDYSSSLSGMQQRHRLSSYSSYHNENSDYIDTGYTDVLGSRRIDHPECQQHLMSTGKTYHNNINVNLDRKSNNESEKRLMKTSRSNNKSSLFFTIVLSIFSGLSFPLPFSSFILLQKYILRILSNFFILLAKILQFLFLHPFNLLLNMIFPLESFYGPSRADTAAKDFCRYICDISGTSPVNKVEVSEQSEIFCPFVDYGLSKLIAELSSRSINTNSNENSSRIFLIQPLLLVYVHSPLHPDSTPFLRDTFLNPSLRSLLSASTIIKCWGGSIHAPEGRRIAHDFGVRGYPFLWVGRIIHTNQSAVNTIINNYGVVGTMETHFRLEGRLLAITPHEVLRVYLETTMRNFHQMMEENVKRERFQREEQMLRFEQDLEYQVALEEDKKKEFIKSQEKKRMQDEINLKQRIMENEERRKGKLLDQARMMLGKEPSGRGENVTRIRFTLPSGRRIDRIFYDTQTVGSLRAFLILYWEGLDNNISCKRSIANFELSCNFPMRSLKGKDDRTLHEEGLFPQAVIMVLDLDS